MHGLVRGLHRQRVERGERGRARRAPQHVGPRARARVPHVLKGRRAEKLCDQLQLKFYKYSVLIKV